jgi:GNAT superfamily N-acetyltransferase
VADELLIRAATGADLPMLLPLCAEHAAYERIEHAAGAREDALARALDDRPPRLYAWIALVDGTAVAYASATLDFSTLDRATYLHMDCLYVRAGWRGRAIGLRLWQVLHGFARSRDCHAMQWQTPDWNVDAARFYRRLGAQEFAKRRYAMRVGDASP